MGRNDEYKKEIVTAKGPREALAKFRYGQMTDCRKVVGVVVTRLHNDEWLIKYKYRKDE